MPEVEQRALAAYQRLFGDGLGLQGAAPMPWEYFHQRYVAAALQERVSNSLKDFKGKGDFPAMLLGPEFVC